jgi:hypothetical protein
MLCCWQSGDIAIKKAQANSVSLPENPLHRLRGIGKEIFKSLDSGENFIRGERESFNTTDKSIRVDPKRIRRILSKMKARADR